MLPLIGLYQAIVLVVYHCIIIARVAHSQPILGSSPACDRAFPAIVCGVSPVSFTISSLWSMCTTQCAESLERFRHQYDADTTCSSYIFPLVQTVERNRTRYCNGRVTSECSAILLQSAINCLKSEQIEPFTDLDLAQSSGLLDIGPVCDFKCDRDFDLARVACPNLRIADVHDAFARNRVEFTDRVQCRRKSNDEITQNLTNNSQDQTKIASFISWIVVGVLAITPFFIVFIATQRDKRHSRSKKSKDALNSNAIPPIVHHSEDVVVMKNSKIIDEEHAIRKEVLHENRIETDVVAGQNLNDHRVVSSNDILLELPKQVTLEPSLDTISNFHRSADEDHRSSSRNTITLDFSSWSRRDFTMTKRILKGQVIEIEEEKWIHSSVVPQRYSFPLLPFGDIHLKESTLTIQSIREGDEMRDESVNSADCFSLSAPRMIGDTPPSPPESPLASAQYSLGLPNQRGFLSTVMRTRYSEQ